MSSSPDRQRPRVAGQRRRHGRVGGPLPGSERVEPVEPVEHVEPVGPVGPVERAEATEPAADAEPPAGDAAGADGIRTPHPARRLAAPLAALVAALLALTVVAAVSLGDHGARERDARTATAAARSSLEQLLSYDHTTVAAQAARNAGLLTGPFRSEYGATMTSKIVPLATKQQVVVRARAYEAGVMSQTEDRVRVQVFLNQARTSTEAKTPTVDQNRVIATMQRVGGRWLVAGLEAY